MDPISLTLAVITASASAVSFLRALFKAIGRFRLYKVRRSRRATYQKDKIVPPPSDLGAASPASAPPPAIRRPAPHREHRWEWNRVEAWGRRYPVALSFATGCVFLVVTILLADSSVGESHGPTASINDPKDGALVPYQVRVEGTSSNVPLDTSPWLFVEANDGDLYPQGGSSGNTVEISRADGSWCGYAFFGEHDARSAGRGYSLILALPTDRADQKLQRELEDGPPAPHWRNLPQGFDQLAPARTVMRLPGARSVDHGSCRKERDPAGRAR
jgi:hypothetical protein